MEQAAFHHSSGKVIGSEHSVCLVSIFGGQQARLSRGKLGSGILCTEQIVG